MEEKIIVKMKFGSHLYGTDTPASDVDIKGVFMPSKEQIFLNKIPKSLTFNTKKNTVDNKNTSEDIDEEYYSLHYFIELACKGETVALDMLHAPNNMLEVTSDTWKAIVANRHKFYTKNLKSFVGYCKRQAAKYGIKGSRLNESKAVIDFLSQYPEEMGMQEIWDKLPEGEHINKTIAFNLISHNNEYEVCGRKTQATAKVGYSKKIFETYYKNYGERAKLASENKNIDWKAVSHAIRAAFQVKEILTDNTITFPLKNADYIKEIKAGKLDYLTQVAPVLENMMDEVEELSIKSNLPEKVNRGFWDNFIIETIKEEIR